MYTAKLFKKGRSQVVRLPQECALPGEEVYVKKIDGIVLLIPKVEDLGRLLSTAWTSSPTISCVPNATKAHSNGAVPSGQTQENPRNDSLDSLATIGHARA